MQTNSVVFSILLPQNVVCFKKLEQATFYSHQIAKYYIKFEYIFGWLPNCRDFVCTIMASVYLFMSLFQKYPAERLS